MAEATGLRNNALPYPVYGAPYGVAFPILDADGDLVTGAAALDSEVSKNGDTFADCTNEATEIATASGMYYLLLTATELTTDVVILIVKTTTSGAKTTPMVLYPKKLPALRSGTAAGGAAGSITLDAGASAVDDRYNGALVVATLDTLVEARIITDYNGSTKVATVTPNWNTTPDSDDTFILYLPDGVQIPDANLASWLDVVPLALSSQRVQVLVGAITNGVIAAATFAANALDAVWSTAARTLTAATNITSTGATTVPQTGDNFARLGAPAGASVSADIAAVKAQTAAIEADTQDLQTRTPAALVGGRMDANMGAVSDDATAADTLELFAEALDPVTGQLDAGSFAAGAFDAVWTVAARTLTSFGTLVADVATAVWGAATRLLTAGTNIVLAKGTGVTGFNDLSAADVRSAVGLASANLDTQLADLPTAGETADAVWDEAVDGAVTARQTLRLANSANGAKASGGGTATFVLRDLADTKDRVTATVDANGNRSAVTRDLT